MDQIDAIIQSGKELDVNSSLRVDIGRFDQDSGRQWEVYHLAEVT